jgi:hypothetical protein
MVAVERTMIQVRPQSLSNLILAPNDLTKAGINPATTLKVAARLIRTQLTMLSNSEP